MAARATLADQRQKIADETFAEARSQLVAFVAGDKYAAWLQNEAAALAEALGENANIAARPADLPAELPDAVFHLTLGILVLSA